MALTQSDLEGIHAAIASGELSIRTSDGKQVTYRSIDELLKAKDAILAEIASTSHTSRLFPRYQVADFSD